MMRGIPEINEVIESMRDSGWNAACGVSSAHFESHHGFFTVHRLNHYSSDFTVSALERFDIGRMPFIGLSAAFIDCVTNAAEALIDMGKLSEIASFVPQSAGMISVKIKKTCSSLSFRVSLYDRGRPFSIRPEREWWKSVTLNDMVEMLNKRNGVRSG